MKSIFLSVVVICALVISGIGGTLAGWSDTEESYNNFIALGSADLKVKNINGIFTDDKPWGRNVNKLVQLKDVVPCQDYKVVIEVQNQGQALDEQGNPLAMPLKIHFKDFACSNVTPTCVSKGYKYDGLWKPEPELVTEYGGVLGQVNILGPAWTPASPGYIEGRPVVRAIGKHGDVACSTTSRVDLTIYFGPKAGGETLVAGPGPMSRYLSQQVYLGDLPQCGEIYEISLVFHMTNLDGGWPGDPKFQGWRTNAWMKDRVDFNMEFELVGPYTPIID